jgi:hypothetical protein
VSTPVLFTRSDSPYLALGCDCYDIQRDARTWPGGCPGIFHPPCRSWGQLAHMAKPRADERALAVWAMEMVREFRGVLEHPINSKLWAHSNCLGWGIRDQWGGVLVPCAQSSWGHRAPKFSGLYMVGIDIPSIPEPGEAVTTVERMCRAEREATPQLLAAWLVDLVGTIQ